MQDSLDSRYWVGFKTVQCFFVFLYVRNKLRDWWIGAWSNGVCRSRWSCVNPRWVYLEVFSKLFWCMDFSELETKHSSYKNWIKTEYFSFFKFLIWEVENNELIIHHISHCIFMRVYRTWQFRQFSSKVLFFASWDHRKI